MSNLGKNQVVAKTEKVEIDNVPVVEKTDLEKLSENPMYIFDLNKKGLMVFGGKIDKFRSADTYNNGLEKLPEIYFRTITKFDRLRKSEYTIDGYSFITYKGSDKGNHFTNVYKDGVCVISNIIQSSVKLVIGVHKGWSKTKMEDEYQIATNRKEEKSSKKDNKLTI
jgi:hypothetical protein